MQKRLIIALLVLAVAGGAYMFYAIQRNKAESTAGNQSVRLKKARLAYKGELPEIALLADLAKDKGFAEKNGLDLEQIKAEKNVDAVLAAGEADYSISGIANPISLYLNGQDTKWLASVSNSAGYGVSRFPKEKSRLIKKVVISKLGGNPQMMAEMLLKFVGADLNKVEYVAMPNDPGKKILLDKGEVDFAAFTSYQFIADAKLAEKYVVYDPKEILKEAGMEMGLIASGKTISQNPEMTEAMVKTLRETLDYLVGNKDDAIKYIESKYEVDSEKASAHYAYFMLVHEGAGFAPDIKKAEFLKPFVVGAYKPTEPERDLAGFIETSFAEEAIK